MNFTIAQEFLGWSILINFGLLLWWFLLFSLAHDWLYKIHGKWFKISKKKFDAIHYGGMAFFEILVFVLNIVPYLVILIIS